MSKEIFRQGVVHSVDIQRGTARVKYPEYAGMISANLKILHQGAVWVPQVNDIVLVVCPPDGDGDGYIIGRF